MIATEPSSPRWWMNRRRAPALRSCAIPTPDALHFHPRRHRVVVAGVLPRLVEPNHLRRVGLHFAARKDPIDPSEVGGLTRVAMERAGLLAFPRIVEEPSLGQDIVRLVRLGLGIEIADENDRRRRPQRLYALADQVGAFLARRLDRVIEVRIPQVELLIRLMIEELHPRHHPPVGVAPRSPGDYAGRVG